MNAPAERQVLRRTEAVCPDCIRPLPAEVVAVEGAVYLERTCPEHGLARQQLSGNLDYWSDLDGFYFDVHGEPAPQRDFIVRMTERCNLDCPICLAKANTEDTPDLELGGLQDVLRARRGMKIDLMAAEPTLREDLEDWVRRVRGASHIAALHTNGIRLADKAYVQRLKRAGVQEVFLQFDGFDDAANQTLRGARLLKRRLRAVDNLREVGLATSLVVVVAGGLNEDQIGATYRYALRPENDHIRELLFLGLRMLGSARATAESAGLGAGAALMPDDLISLFCDQVPDADRDDIRRFNKVYFAMLSALRVRKCLYIQHHLVARTSEGGRPAAAFLDLPAMETACERFRSRLQSGAPLARPRLLAELAAAGMRGRTARLAADLLRLQDLLRSGVNLSKVPRKLLLVGFITACDPDNYDARVAAHCGKGELSADGGYEESGANANIARERRFRASGKPPGPATPGARLIPRTAEYALRALAMLALHPDEPLRTAQIAEQCDIPERYLSAVMRDQVRAGLVRSQRGRNGGYILVGPAESIPLDAVLKAAGFDVTARPCGFGWPSCDREDPCPLHPLFEELNTALQRWALGRTLGEVEPGRWPMGRSRS